jgi:hypothetical protein
MWVRRIEDTCMASHFEQSNTKKLSVENEGKI